MSFYCCVTRVVQGKMISINQWLGILVTELKRNIQDCEFVDENIIFLFNCDNGELGIKFTLTI